MLEAFFIAFYSNKSAGLGLVLWEYVIESITKPRCNRPN